MAKTKNGLPGWAETLLAIFIVGGLIWALVPREILYLSIGIAVVIIGGVSYLVYRKHGVDPFKKLANKIVKSLTAQRKVERLSPLPSHEADRLKVAVGNRCEICGEHRNLEVHHIIPQNEDDSSHNPENLLVLCHDCHRDAGHGEPSRYRQQLIAKKREAPPILRK